MIKKLIKQKKKLGLGFWNRRLTELESRIRRKSKSRSKASEDFDDFERKLGLGFREYMGNLENAESNLGVSRKLTDSFPEKRPL